MVQVQQTRRIYKQKRLFWHFIALKCSARWFVQLPCLVSPCCHQSKISRSRCGTPEIFASSWCAGWKRMERICPSCKPIEEFKSSNPKGVLHTARQFINSMIQICFQCSARFNSYFLLRSRNPYHDRVHTFIIHQNRRMPGAHFFLFNRHRALISGNPATKGRQHGNQNKQNPKGNQTPNSVQT